MPKIVTNRTKFPDGWEVVKDTLDEFERKMRDAIAEPHEGKRKAESLWPVMQINHQRSRYIYIKYFKEHAISKEVSILILEATSNCIDPCSIGVQILHQTGVCRWKTHRQVEKGFPPMSPTSFHIIYLHF